MTMPKLAAASLLLALQSAPAAQAQVTIDMAKVTCEQYLLFQVADPQHIAIWIHGYYAGKRNSTILDVQQLKANADKVRDYCRANMKNTVMQGVETLFGPPPR
jgi:acid stress chaperone HdeB